MNNFPYATAAFVIAFGILAAMWLYWMPVI